MGHAITSRLLTACERLAIRYLLGLQPDPAIWPPPHDRSALAVPEGIRRNDSHGPVWSLDEECLPVWHRRRTAIGAQVYRFRGNFEYDCGWRLVDVAARFWQREGNGIADAVAIVPQPLTFGQDHLLRWVGRRLSAAIDARFVPDLFTVAGPLAEHPDVRRPPWSLPDVFSVADDPTITLNGSRILLCDWRYHQGRTLTFLTRKLSAAGASVVRLTWLE